MKRRVAVGATRHVHRPGVGRVHVHPDRAGRGTFVVGAKAAATAAAGASTYTLRSVGSGSARPPAAGGRGPSAIHALRCACSSRPARITWLAGPVRPARTTKPLGPARPVRAILPALTIRAAGAVHAARAVRTGLEPAIPVAFLLEPDPYVALTLRARVGAYPDGRGRCEVRVARYRDAPGGTRFVRPAVVAAPERMAEIGAHGKPDPPMRTPVLPCVHGPRRRHARPRALARAGRCERRAGAPASAPRHTGNQRLRRRSAKDRSTASRPSAHPLSGRV